MFSKKELDFILYANTVTNQLKVKGCIVHFLKHSRPDYSNGEPITKDIPQQYRFLHWTNITETTNNF